MTLYRRRNLRWRWINRVVPLQHLEDEADKLAAEIAPMPSVPALMTKDHVNAITRDGAGLSSYNDADIAMAMPSEKESQAAAHTYAESKVGKDRRPKRKLMLSADIALRDSACIRTPSST